ncbi:hypothetical protein PENTCL1PPCAC_9404, partial [Pristionchus entomophagus]
WFPSLFGRGSADRGQEPPSDSSDSPPRTVSKKSKSKSSDSKSKSSRDSEKSASAVEEWTVACLNSVMLPARQELSGVFAPVPLLALFCIVWMSATEEVRKHMKSVCGIDKSNVKAFSALLARITPSINVNSLMIYRILTTPDQIPTIDPLFTTKLHKRFGRRALIPADRDKQRDYIRTNTKRMISDLSVPSSAGLLGFAAASVAERWQAETRPHPDRPFALNQRQKQLHECFEARGPMRILREARIDSLLLPFRDSALALAILRPTERGGIVRLRGELTGRELAATLQKLGEKSPVVSRVLLPRVELRQCDPSLLPKWRLSGVLSERVCLRKKGGERVCPQFREIAAGASIRIDERGVNAVVEERYPRSSASSSSSTRSYYSAAIDSSLDPNFNLRLDSPFLFFVVHVESMAPILAGTYAGESPPSSVSKSLSKSASRSSKSLARKSLDVIRRPLRKVRKSSTKSSSASANSPEEHAKSEEKEWKGVPKCEGCEERSKERSKKSGKSKAKSVLQPVPQPAAASATTAAAPRATTPAAAASAPRRTSVRETLKETHRSTRTGVNLTVSAARDGIVQAAKIGGDKIGKGLDKTKQTAVHIASKNTEKLEKAKDKVSSTAKSIGRVLKRSPLLSSLSRSRGSSSRSRAKEEEQARETTESSERAPIRV